MDKECRLFRLSLMYVGVLLSINNVHGSPAYLIPDVGKPETGILVETDQTAGWVQVLSQPRHDLSSSQSRYFSLDGIFGGENKSLLINASDENIFIKGWSGDSVFQLLPISALGTKYIVSSSQTHGGHVSYLVIATHSQVTDVDITFKLQGTLTYDGRTYRDGDNLTLILGEYEVISMKSDFDLSGTVVNTVQTVAVFSGSLFDIYTDAFDQLLPVQYYGQEYIVAVDDYFESYELQIVSEHSDAHILFNNGSSASVDGSGIYRQSLAKNALIHFTSSRPVMTTVWSGDEQRGTIVSFVVVPPVTLYIKHTVIDTEGVFKIFTSAYATDTLVSNSSMPDIPVTWEEIPDIGYKVGTVTSFTSYTNTWTIDPYSITSSTNFNVLVFDLLRLYNGGYTFRSIPQQQVCDNEHYGPGCSGICATRHCKGVSSCNPMTGQCDGGCQTGWAGTQCTVCDSDHYGADCSRTCDSRHCEGSSSCNPTTGQCDSGCQTGWSGIDCTGEAKHNDQTDQNSGDMKTASNLGTLILCVILRILST